MLVLALALAACSEKKPAAPRPETAHIIAAAKAGDPRAQMLLGQMHRLGDDMPKDANASLHWYRQAALAGLPDAQHNLAVALQQGFGGKPNPTEAAQWHQRAAMQGLAVAQFDLARLFLFGKGVEANATMAFHWFDEAARHGHRDALFHLGIMRRDGQGVPQDLAQAGKYFLMATDLGLLDAQAEYHLLSSKMTPAQRTTAETLAREQTARITRGPSLSAPLLVRGGLLFAPGQEQPYSGHASFMHTNGVRAQEMDVLQGRRHGWERTWHPNGQPQGETEFNTGQRHGRMSFWYSNGRPQMAGTNQHGRLLHAMTLAPDGKPAGTVREGNGTMTLFHGNGSIADELKYESGRLLKVRASKTPADK